MEDATQPKDKNVCIPDTRWNRYQLLKRHLGGESRPEVFPLGETNGADNKEPISTALDANYWKGIDNHGQRTAISVGTLRTHSDGNDQIAILPEKAQIRRLTPLECERLQAFPDRWTEFGKDGKPISDTQRYKMTGNAVTTNVIQAVFERIFDM